MLLVWLLALLFAVSTGTSDCLERLIPATPRHGLLVWLLALLFAVSTGTSDCLERLVSATPRRAYNVLSRTQNSAHWWLWAVLCVLKLVQSMTAVERLASLLAAISHDLDHPGTNQSFLIATSNPLVPLYQVLIACSLFAVGIFYFIYFMYCVLSPHHLFVLIYELSALCSLRVSVCTMQWLFLCTIYVQIAQNWPVLHLLLGSTCVCIFLNFLICKSFQSLSPSGWRWSMLP